MDHKYEHIPCTLCGKNDTVVFVRSDGPAQIVRCRNDGLIYVNPRPAVQHIEHSSTEQIRYDNLPLFTQFRETVLKRHADALNTIKTEGKILDIGCATGSFLENFNSPKWQLYGVDTSPLGVKLTTERLGAETFCGDLLNAQYPSDFFDLVTTLDTLYYLADPKAALVEIRRILKTGGLLAVEIPGFNYRRMRDKGLLCWLLDGRWSRMLPASLNIPPAAQHLYYFSPTTFRSLLTKAGFRVLKVIPEQAPMARGGLLRALNDLHFWFARSVFNVTGGVSIAAKELYVAEKVVRASQV